MATQPEKAFLVLDFHFTKPVTTIQRGFLRKFRKYHPCTNSIRFNGLSRHFTVMRIGALPVAMV
jgi:hypothetical protein